MKSTKTSHLKKTLSLVMAIILTFGVFASANLGSLVAFAAERKGEPVAPLVTSYWCYYSDGEIRFTGDIPAIADTDSIPWVSYVSKITTVTIDPNNVTSIGANGLKLLNVNGIYIPKTVTTIDSNAFSNSSIREIFYEGSKTEWESKFTAVVDGLKINYNHTHTSGLIKHSVDATCTQKGYEGDKYCSVCGAFYENGEDLPKTNHSWSKNYAVMEAPTCIKGGKEAKYCTICDSWDYSTIRDLAPTGLHEWAVLPDDKVEDCQAFFGKDLQDEHITMHCVNCNVSSEDPQFKDFIFKDKDGNTYGNKDTAFTELSAATQKKIVNKEAVEYNRQLNIDTAFKGDKTNWKVKHVYHYETTDPTCTEDGQVLVTCEWCKNYTDSYVLKAKGHSNVTTGEVVDYVIPAGCPTDEDPDASGERGTRCTVCGEILSSEKIPNNHTKGYWSGYWKTIVKPTCVQDGYQWLVCNYCGKYILDEEGNYVKKDLPKTPDQHGNSRWFTTLYPTCTEKGEEIQVCTVEGCPYYSNTDIGSKAVKISDRDTIDFIQKVIGDTNTEHYHYDTTVPADKRVTDVANTWALSLLAAYRAGKDLSVEADSAALKEELTEELKLAITKYGKEGLDKDGNEAFLFDIDQIVEARGLASADEFFTAESTARFEFKELCEKAIELFLEDPNHEYVIITTEQLIALFEQAWYDLGTEEMEEVVLNTPADVVKRVTDQALAKKVIPELGHDYVRVPYIQVNTEFIPVCKVDGEDGWYRIQGYDEAGEPLAEITDEDGNVITEKELIPGEAVTYVNCIEGDGNMIYQCRRCMKLDDPKLVKQGSHDLKTKHFAPTCYEDGYDHTYCTKCDYFVDTVTEIHLTHNFVETTIKESTCSKAGIKVKICSYCGLVDTATYQTLATLPHQDSNVNEIATCSEPGRVGVVCSVCGRFDGQVIDALGHDYKDTVVEPTCTELGYTVATCSRCGDTKAASNYVPAAGHQYGKAINMAATCDTGSYTYEECRICGYKKIYNEKNDALGHEMVTKSAKAATCLENGYTERIYCSRPGCSYVQKESKVLPALGHTPGAGPTCTKPQKCIRCDYIFKKALGHTPDRSKATCTEDKTCTRCLTVLEKATGHSYGEWVTTKEYTAFRNGEKARTCSKCGAVETAKIVPNIFQRIIWIFTHFLDIILALLGRANNIF